MAIHNESNIWTEDKAEPQKILYNKKRPQAQMNSYLCLVH